MPEHCFLSLLCAADTMAGRIAKVHLFGESVCAEMLCMEDWRSHGSRTVFLGLNLKPFTMTGTTGGNELYLFLKEAKPERCSSRQMRDEKLKSSSCRMVPAMKINAHPQTPRCPFWQMTLHDQNTFCPTSSFLLSYLCGITWLRGRWIAKRPQPFSCNKDSASMPFEFASWLRASPLSLSR